MTDCAYIVDEKVIGEKNYFQNENWKKTSTKLIHYFFESKFAIKIHLLLLTISLFLSIRFYLLNAILNDAVLLEFPKNLFS